MMKIKKRVFIFFFYLLLISCDDNKSSECYSETSGRGKIISVLPLGDISSSFLSDFLIDNNIDIGVVPENDVEVYSIVYQTIDWNNVIRHASGAIYIPKIECITICKCMRAYACACQSANTLALEPKGLARKCGPPTPI